MVPGTRSFWFKNRSLSLSPLPSNLNHSIFDDMYIYYHQDWIIVYSMMLCSSTIQNHPFRVDPNRQCHNSFGQIWLPPSHYVHTCFDCLTDLQGRGVLWHCSTYWVRIDCDTTVHTMHPYALYVLYCLTLMYCTYYTYCILYVLCTFPVSHVEASSSTSVHTCSRT